MFDKNGKEIKTGDVVEITGAYFKSDNGLYFIDRAPGDPCWTGNAYCLKKICRNGQLSKAKNNICFWPIEHFVSSLDKRREAAAWDEKNAQIEVKTIQNMDGIAQHFQQESRNLEAEVQRLVRIWGREDKEIQAYREAKTFYEAVAERVKKGQE